MSWALVLAMQPHLCNSIFLPHCSIYKYLESTKYVLVCVYSLEGYLNRINEVGSEIKELAPLGEFSTPWRNQQNVIFMSICKNFIRHYGVDHISCLYQAPACSFSILKKWQLLFYYYLKIYKLLLSVNKCRRSQKLWKEKVENLK